MIKSIYLRNYKAFDIGEIKVKPITILLGANSVGKSSLLQLFLMLQQTAQSDKSYKSALKLHGGFTSMGEGLNLIRKKDKTKILTLAVTVSDKKIFSNLNEDIKSRFFEEFLYFVDLIEKLEHKKSDKKGKAKSSLTPILSKLMDVSDKHEHIYDLHYLSLTKKFDFDNLFKNESFENIVNETSEIVHRNDYTKLPNEVKENYFYFRYELSNYVQIRERKQDFFLLKKFLENLSDHVTNAEFSLKWELESVDKILIIKEFSIFHRDKNILSILFNSKNQITGAKYYFKSDLVDFNVYNSSFNTNKRRKEIFFSDKPIFSFYNADQDELNDVEIPIIDLYVKRIIVPILKSAANNFDYQSINYVSPLRAGPKRYYFLDKARYNTTLDTLDGDAIAEILKEKSSLKHLVNNWLKKFNLKIDVNHLEDIIHKLTVNQNSLDLDITDVGFGISQVLPVIIQGFLSKNDSLTLIEQPEIHLHPKMQADLADLFIDIILPNKTTNTKPQAPKKFLLIETHSEYLLKRIRRRMAEGVLNPDNVAIYLIDPQEGKNSANIRELKIENKGAFEWPKDFYSDELLRDTTEFLRLQD